MDCKTARLVWNHPEGFISGVRQHLPGVLERLEAQVDAYVRGETNPYNESVRNASGVDGSYHLAHGLTDDDPVATGIHDVLGDVAGKAKIEQYFSELFGQKVCLGNVCCSGCITSTDPLHPDEMLKIQHAAVNTESDGSIVRL